MLLIIFSVKLLNKVLMSMVSLTFIVVLIFMLVFDTLSLRMAFAQMNL